MRTRSTGERLHLGAMIVATEFGRLERRACIDDVDLLDIDLDNLDFGLSVKPC
jgi:hypothetical protein